MGPACPERGAPALPPTLLGVQRPEGQGGGPRGGTGPRERARPQQLWGPAPTPPNGSQGAPTMCRAHTEHRRARACLMGADANRWPLCDCPGDNGSLGTAVGWNVQSHCEAKVTRPRRGSGSQPDGRPLPCPDPSRRSPRPPWLSPRRHTGRSPAWVTAKSRPSLRRPGTSGSEVAPPFPGSSVEGELMTTPTFNAEPVYRARHGRRWRHRECWAPAPGPAGLHPLPETGPGGDTSTCLWREPPPHPVRRRRP